MIVLVLVVVVIAIAPAETPGARRRAVAERSTSRYIYGKNGNSTTKNAGRPACTNNSSLAVVIVQALAQVPGALRVITCHQLAVVIVKALAQVPGARRVIHVITLPVAIVLALA